jgi:outer membrane protein OmpA-like peptidoglycan-associated protein
MKKTFLFLLMTCIVSFTYAQQDDPGCSEKTFKFFTPFDGFYLKDYCNYSEFGSYEFLVDNGARSIKKEGVYREVWFQKKDDNTRTVSGLQILQNHVNAIKAVGGTVVKESDGSVFKTTYQGKELWIYVNSNTNSTDLDNYGIMSIEVDVMKQEVSAQDIKGSIDSQGKIALYGILFDTGKSDIKPESEPSIRSVAGYLTDNPGVNVFIVGHTDNTGNYDMNLKLSKSRGESVRNYLVAKYNISPARLTGDGVGPVCPVSTNDTDAGKALNRRVEIVKK